MENKDKQMCIPCGEDGASDTLNSVLGAQSQRRMAREINSIQIEQFETQRIWNAEDLSTKEKVEISREHHAYYAEERRKDDDADATYAGKMIRNFAVAGFVVGGVRGYITADSDKPEERLKNAIKHGVIASAISGAGGFGITKILPPKQQEIDLGDASLCDDLENT